MAARSVFVTVGTTCFDALIEAMDQAEVAQALVANKYTRLVLQVGRGQYKPHNLFEDGSCKTRYQDILDVEWFEFAPSLEEHMASAALVVSHAGSGSLFEALRLGKPTVAVPNPVLMDNHQAELAAQLAEDKYLFCATTDEILSVLKGMDPSILVPYPAGNPAHIARFVDKLMSFD